MRRAARLLLGAALAVSLALGAISGWQLGRNPALRGLMLRGEAEARTRLERLLAAEATAEGIDARIAALLAEEPHNWVALEALDDLAAKRGLRLGPATRAAYDAAHEAEHGAWAAALACAECAADIATCPLSPLLACGIAVEVTPYADVRDLNAELGHYLSGEPVDALIAGLSVVGLASLVAAPETLGGSLTVKAGATALKLAARLGRLSAGMSRWLADLARRAVDWDAVRRLGRGDGAWTADSLGTVIRKDELAAVEALVDDLTAMDSRLGSHLRGFDMLRHVDGPADARGLARAAEAVGPRLTALVELAGKNRVLRAVTRWSDQLRILVAAVAAAYAAALSLALGLAQSLGLRLLRRLAG